MKKICTPNAVTFGYNILHNQRKRDSRGALCLQVNSGLVYLHAILDRLIDCSVKMKIVRS